MCVSEMYEINKVAIGLVQFQLNNTTAEIIYTAIKDALRSSLRIVVVS